HERDVEATPYEIATDHVEHDRRPPVPHMRNFIDGRPAHIDRNPPRRPRHQLDLLARIGVVDPHHRSSTLSSSATAHTAIPSPRPMNPRPSPRLGLTATGASTPCSAIIG